MDYMLLATFDAEDVVGNSLSTKTFFPGGGGGVGWGLELATWTRLISNSRDLPPRC